MGKPHEAARIGAIGRRRVDVGDWAAGPMLSFDNLEVVLIALIIAIHGILGYVGFDQFWSYADVQEVVLSPVTEIVLLAVIVPFGLFMIALLFLVAGLGIPRSDHCRTSSRRSTPRTTLCELCAMMPRSAL